MYCQSRLCIIDAFCVCYILIGAAQNIARVAISEIRIKSFFTSSRCVLSNYSAAWLLATSPLTNAAISSMQSSVWG